MKTYLLNLWDTIRTSYWFVPALFAVLALICALVIPVFDAAIVKYQFPLPESIRTSTATARATLSAIASAMMAVTGTVFSITIVTLSLTSQQFGPRLLRRFMYDLPTQITLGVFLSTGFYCLLVLRVVEQSDNGVTAPHLSVFMAVVLAVLSMAMLIVFIHHVAILIQAPYVVTAVASDLDDSINRLYPERTEESVSQREQFEIAAQAQEAALGDDSQLILSSQEGYLQAIDEEGLIDMTEQYGLVLNLRVRPGDFIVKNSPLVDLWCDEECSAEKESQEKLTAMLNDKFIVGIRRTPRQDVECAIDELTEVAVRSLSPGINDPFTAMNCIDRLGASLGRLAERIQPTAYRCDGEGRLRVITRPVSFGDSLAAAFNQIRQYGRQSVAVTIRLLESLTSIAEHAHRAEDREAIRLHAEMIARSVESLSEGQDIQDIEERVERLLESLEVNRQ